MGIARISARLLLSEASKRPFCGRVLQLGRQHLFINEVELKAWANAHGINLKKDHVDSNKRAPLLDPNYIDDGSFFAMLGFKEVESCDFSADENPTHVFDLNKPVPEKLVGRFDLVYDGGTLEHLYDTPQALRNIHTLLKVGGRVIHHSPSTNHVDHGFYMFSPCLFADYYAANSYGIEDFHLVEYERNFMTQLASIYNYVPGGVDDVSFGGFDRGKMLLVHMVARKLSDSTSDATPQQGQYARSWKDTAAGVALNKAYERAFGGLIAEYEATRSVPNKGQKKFRMPFRRARRATRVLDTYKIGDW